VSDSFSARMIEAAKAYFVAVDSGRPPDELFARDFEFFFPKYGVGSGVDEFHALAAGLGAAGYKATHYRDRLKYLVSGQQLIVEGTTFGIDGHGGAWDVEKRQAVASAVFDFNDEGLISRMYIYLDPDYTSLDKERFHWRRAEARW
jgi:hypothetical protein